MIKTKQLMIMIAFSILISFMQKVTLATENGKGNMDTVSPGSAQRVDGHDLYIITRAFGSERGDTCWNQPADLNKDLIVDGEDLVILASNFGNDQPQDPVSNPWPMLGNNNQHTNRTNNVGVQASDSTFKWSYGVGNFVTNGDNSADIIVGYNDIIYAYVNDDYLWNTKLYAIDPVTHSSKWVYKVRDYDGIYKRASCTPVIDKYGIIYIKDEDGGIHAINSFTGEGEIKTYATPWAPIAIDDNGVIYSAGDSSNLVAINPNGTQKWSYNPKITHPDTYIDKWLTPTIGQDGTIYVGVRNSNVVAERGLLALTSDGNRKWFFSSIGNITITPAIGSDGTIYTGSDYFYAIKPDGSLKWKISVDSSSYNIYDVEIPAIGSDGTIYFIKAGILNAIDSSNGNTKWRINIENISIPKFSAFDHGMGTITIDGDGTIYVGLLAINSNGTEKWRYNGYNTYYREFSSPKIGSDGSLYVPYENGILIFGTK